MSKRLIAQGFFANHSGAYAVSQLERKTSGARVTTWGVGRFRFSKRRNMGYVRAHTRKDGTQVRAHTRSPRRRAAATSRATAPTTNSPTCRVNAHVRKDGTQVRSHRRSIPTRSSVPQIHTPSALGAGGVLLALVLVLLGATKAAHSDPVPHAPQTDTRPAVTNTLPQ